MRSRPNRELAGSWHEAVSTPADHNLRESCGPAWRRGQCRKDGGQWAAPRHH